MNIYNIVSLLLLLLLIMDTTYGTRTRNNTVISSSKTANKVSYPKKVYSLKNISEKSPTLSTSQNIEKSKVKKAVDVTAAFKDFPEDDLDFITELDKQFEAHGDKIKFKIEQYNATDTKNSKRTIDGELGYGNYPNGYEYNRPKYMFYPYSQNDILSNAPSYQSPYEKTKVTIEPSHSYELKTYPYIEHYNQPHIDVPSASAVINQNAQAVQQHPHQEQYEEPVIVLRIPGPTKYASHLQTLLQQYLEIRAAQYLHILEETDLQKQKQYHEQEHDLSQVHTQQQQHPHIDLQPPTSEHSEHNAAAAPNQLAYKKQVNYDDQVAPTPPPVVYPSTDNVQQTYKDANHHNHMQQIQQLPLTRTSDYYADAYTYRSPEIQKEMPQYYYMQEPQYIDAPQNLPTTSPALIDKNYHNVYYIAMGSSVNYEDPQHHQSPQLQEYKEIFLSENNPRKTHTKIIFTNNGEQSADNMYPLPSIRPYERHASKPLPTYHQHHHQQQLAHESQTADFNYESVTPNVNIETVAITQRTYNYHAQPLNVKAHHIAYKRGTEKDIVSRSTSDTSEQVDNRLEKIREYIRDKLGAKKGSTVEFKTTEVVEGIAT